MEKQYTDSVINFEEDQILFCMFHLGSYRIQ